MEFRLLGPLEVRGRDGEVLALARRQQRVLLGALLVRAGEVVSVERLVDELWGEQPPASAVGSLQNAVSQLRKTLGAELVRTQPPGYVLAVAPELVDARRFERLLGEAGGLEPAARAALLREALALWRGPALADLREHAWAEQEAARLEELRLTALEDMIGAELDLGRHAALVAQLEALAAGHPLRERLRRQLALALYRSGRQAEALEACRAARAALDELGLEPSAELRALERDILQQSPTLAAAVEIAEARPAAMPGERRVVSVLAASMPEDEDPEALRAALARVLEAAQAAVRRHGGELERFGAEGLTAVFGADGSREDDALRAVRAAVELHEAAGVSAGVATGEAIVGDDPHVAGAAVARAAGLARGGDGVLVDPRTLELVRESATVETAGPPARVLAIEAERPAERSDTPLVGRSEELTQLCQAFEHACTERRCRVVTVAGEPGIGKTRLARELAASVDAVVLVGRCAAYGEGAIFLPLVQALRSVDAAEALAGEDDAELVVRRVEQLAGAAQEPGSLGESYWAVRRLLEALAREQPVALVLDDVHWAEPVLLDLVEYLAARVTDAPLLVLCLARPELLDDRLGWAAEALRLGPLPEEETRELVERTAALDDEARERIVELAEGNPLYAQQLAAYAQESGKALEPGAMPATIDAVLAGRLGRLEAGERATLQRAAVVGRDFTRGAVAALAPPDLAVDAHLLALARRGLVRATPDALPGDDAYRFHHVLLRDAAYATLTKEQRADLHERVAAWLDRDGPGDDALAGYHLEQAALLLRELGVDASELGARAGERLGSAGWRTWAAGNTLTTIGLLTRATNLLPASARRAELVYELTIALRNAGHLDDADEALAHAEREAAEAGDVRIVARSRVERSSNGLYAGTASPDEVEGVLREAIPLFERLADDRGLGRAWNVVAGIANFRMDNAALAEASARSEFYYSRVGFSTALPIGLQAAALWHGSTPAPTAILRCQDLLERATDRAGGANVMCMVGALLAMRGDHAAAEETLETARATYDELGMRVAVAVIWSQPAMEAARLGGRLAEAAAMGMASLEKIIALRQAPNAATRAAQIADLMLDIDDGEAARLLTVARRHISRNDVLVQSLIRSVGARLEARRGRPERGESLARRAVVLTNDSDALVERARAQLTLAEVLFLADRHDESRAAVKRAEQLFTAKQTVEVERARRLPTTVPA